MFYLFIFILGASIGSFLNVLIDRLPKGQSISGRSHCDSCRHKLSWSDLIPIISFFLLKGKCRYCGKNISRQYSLVEIITGIAFVVTFVILSRLKGGEESLNLFESIAFARDPSLSLRMTAEMFGMIASLGIISCLIVIFFSDLKYQIIPDSIQIALFFFAFLSKLFFSNYQLPITNYLISGFFVMLPILFLYLVTRGRGMGFGDVKLSFTIGFLLGIKAGFLALYFGFVIGGIVGLTLLLLKKKKLKSKIAFGPFLVVGILIMFFWQKEILEIIDKIYGF